MCHIFINSHKDGKCSVFVAKHCIFVVKNRDRSIRNRFRNELISLVPQCQCPIKNNRLWSVNFDIKISFYAFLVFYFPTQNRSIHIKRNATMREFRLPFTCTEIQKFVCEPVNMSAICLTI